MNISSTITVLKQINCTRVTYPNETPLLNVKYVGYHYGLLQVDITPIEGGQFKSVSYILDPNYDPKNHFMYLHAYRKIKQYFQCNEEEDIDYDPLNNLFQTDNNSCGMILCYTIHCVLNPSISLKQEYISSIRRNII